MDEKPNYRNLLVWKKAHENALEVIVLFEDNYFPAKYDRIISQCLQAVTSIGANIAEGNSSASEKDKLRFFEIALKSAYEFDNWVQVSKDSDAFKKRIKKGNLTDIEKRNIEVIKILSRLLNPLS